MINRPRISELLIETQAFKDLEKPVILTSGELGIYYINTEKLCQDSGEFEKYGNNSREMIQHAIKMMVEHPTFEEVINILIENVKELIKQDKKYVISGGQRRDWLFSGPVAHKLGLRHVSLYKDGQIELIDKGEICSFLELKREGREKETKTSIHISDLLTEGSSAYRVENGEEKGWIPMLRKENIVIEDLIAIVTRKQGGEERLKKQNVNVKSFVAIDEDFVSRYSKNPSRALSYIKNPKEWSENYLRENGALVLIENFNPSTGKLDRAKKFLERYGKILNKSRKLEELEKTVQEKYRKSLSELTRIN